jgi:hypothetical protein
MIEIRDTVERQLVASGAAIVVLPGAGMQIASFHLN